MRKEIEYSVNPTAKATIIAASVVVIISFFLPWGGMSALGYKAYISGWTILKGFVEGISKSGFEGANAESVIVALGTITNVLFPLIASILILIKVIGASQDNASKGIKTYIQINAIVPLALWVISVVYIGIKIGDIEFFFKILKNLIALGIITTAGGLVLIIVMAPMLLMKKPVPDTKVCPMCAEEVKFAAKVCRFCGHKFEVQEGIANSIKERVKDEYEEVANSLVKTFIESDDIHARTSAIEDLAKYNNAIAKEAIRKALTDKTYLVRNMAVSVIDYYAEDNREAILHAYEKEKDTILRKRLKKMLKKAGEEV